MLLPVCVCKLRSSPCQSVADPLLKVSLPEASDFIARAPDVLTLTHSQENADFLKGIQDEARQAGIWLEAGIHAKASAGPLIMSNTDQNQWPSTEY